MGIISVQKPESVCLQSNLSALYSYLICQVLFDWNLHPCFWIALVTKLEVQFIFGVIVKA